jgi:hypothetical protein
MQRKLVGLRRLASPVIAMGLLVFVATVSVASADTVRVSDLLEGEPTVSVLDGSGNDVTASRVTILADSGSELLHFKLAAGNKGVGATGYTDLFEDFVGGTLSDRIVIFLDPTSNNIDVQFASDPATIALPGGAINLGFDAVENGNFQAVALVFNTEIGNGMYNFSAQSDIDSPTVPEPATLALTGTGLVALARLRRRRASSLRQSS